MRSGKTSKISASRHGLPPAPAQVGTSRTGKLSADQWRSFCTIHLVVTLTRLWGSQNTESRQRQMLHNFMDLVTATKLALMRTMSADRAKLYHETFLAYLRGLQSLYPHISLTPKQPRVATSLEVPCAFWTDAFLEDVRLREDESFTSEC